MGAIFSNLFSPTHDAQTPEDGRRCILARCDQDAPLPFEDEYTVANLSECRKIGEGSFGEVFIFTDVTSKEKTVLKVIPFGGDLVNDAENEKAFKAFLSEVLIAQELSGLRNKELHPNVTSNFVHVKKVKCVQGTYPAVLLKHSEDYCKENGTSVFDPSSFNEGQLYIVLELPYGGINMDEFVFTSAEQAYCALKQVVYALAVAEKELSFEHRDLHRGNLLFARTKKRFIEFTLDGKNIKLRSKGVEVTIIDFTLSRVTYEDEVFCKDLTREIRFSLTGDYQFDIYRNMRQQLNNIWTEFCPKTNVFWVHYLVDRMLNYCTYKQRRTQTHLDYMTKLQCLMDTMLGVNSSVELIPLLEEIS